MIKQICPSGSTPQLQQKQEISRILSAAVVSNHFRRMLLSDAIAAIANGYSGESFLLDREDQEKLQSIHASSLAEFAAQLSAL